MIVDPNGRRTDKRHNTVCKVPNIKRIGFRDDLCESKEPLGWDRNGLPVQLYVGSTKRPGAARGTLSTDNRAC